MARVTKYLKTIEDLNSEWKLDLKPEETAEGLRLLECDFMPEAAYLKAKNSSNRLLGLLLPHLQNDRKRKYLSEGISFLDDKGELFLVHTDRALHIKTEGLLSKKAARKTNSTVVLDHPVPYFLISPNALAIAETLMRLPSPHLQEFRSGLKFCEQYDLYQPKFSEIAKRLKVRTVEEMAKKIKSIRADDWLAAFETTAARRFMTPFYTKAEPFYSLLPEDSLQESQSLSDVYEKYKKNVLPGPSEVAKQMGVLIETNVNLWVLPETLAQLKKYKRLVPGQSKEHRTWLIAVADRGFEREEVASHILQDKRLPGDPLQNNILRAAWDLTFSDTRTREVRKFLLRRLMNEL